MLNKNITLDHKPPCVKVEVLPEGVRRVALYDYRRILAGEMTLDDVPLRRRVVVLMVGKGG